MQLKKQELKGLILFRVLQIHNMRKAGFILFLSVLLSCTSQNDKIQSISKTEFKTLYKENPELQLLDVRTLKEFESGSIFGAILIDVKKDNFLELSEKVFDKNKPVYIYCKSGYRSSTAANKLLSKQFKQVYCLSGGYNAWTKNNN